MKKYLVIAVIALAIIVGLLAFYHFVPFWAVLVSTGAFIAGIVAGWFGKKKSLEKLK